MGRPKILEPRVEQLNLRLTSAEFRDICARAEAIGMQPVQFGRTLLLDRAREIPASTAVPRDTPAQRLIYGQLARLGNNLNQLVRHLHHTGDPLPADLEPLLADIRQILDRRVAP